MATCEKCWSDARTEARLTSGDHVQIYHRLLDERSATPCSPAEQCGDLHIVLEFVDGSRRCRCGKVVVREAVQN